MILDRPTVQQQHHHQSINQSIDVQVKRMFIFRPFNGLAGLKDKKNYIHPGRKVEK